jgi:outer membrane lipoprotein carrier protein
MSAGIGAQRRAGSAPGSKAGGAPAEVGPDGAFGRRWAWRLAGLGWLIAGLAGIPLRAEPIDQLHQFLSQTTTARGDFTQQSAARSVANGGADKASATGLPAVAHGDFEFLRPGRFRWTYRTPYEQLIVSDGTSLFLYDKDLNQVTKRKLNGALPASPASILFGSNDFEHDFHVENDGSSKGVEWIKATPKAKDSVFERIRIGFAGGLPVAMELRDSFGQSTQLQFEHVQRNPSLAADRFAFAPPAGVDVLEDR